MCTLINTRNISAPLVLKLLKNESTFLSHFVRMCGNLSKIWNQYWFEKWLNICKCHHDGLWPANATWSAKLWRWSIVIHFIYSDTGKVFLFKIAHTLPILQVLTLYLLLFFFYHHDVWDWKMLKTWSILAPKRKKSFYQTNRFTTSMVHHGINLKWPSCPQFS